jgi:hypothetical protein
MNNDWRLNIILPSTTKGHGAGTINWGDISWARREKEGGQTWKLVKHHLFLIHIILVFFIVWRVLDLLFERR